MSLYEHCGPLFFRLNVNIDAQEALVIGSTHKVLASPFGHPDRPLKRVMIVIDMLNKMCRVDIVVI